MRAPSVIIVANPYEGELLGRALADTGLRILRADAGDGAHALIATELPIAVVLGVPLVGADAIGIVNEARARHPSISLFLIAEPEEPMVAELGSRVTSTFRRPPDFDALAHAIERLAVAAEFAEVDESMIEHAQVPPPFPRARTMPTTHPGGVAPLVRAHRTDVLPEEPRAPEPTLLRMDEALGGLAIDDDLARKVSRVPDRSTIARRIDRELSQAERRLFPEGPGTPLPFGQDDYDDALADIDLDALAIDTIPGLPHDERRSRSTRHTREAGAFATAEPAMARRAIQEEGTLDTVDIAELVARLHANAFSGALHVERPEGEKTLFFDEGEPIGARSSLRHDQLGEMLFREGKLSREQVAKLRTESLADGTARPIATRLVELGLLKESELFSAARRHVEEIFFSLFSLQDGRFRVGPELPIADERVRLSATTWSLVLEGIRRKYGLERLTKWLGGRDAVLRTTTLYPRVLEGAGLTSDERRVAALVDGEHSLSELRASLGGRIAESVVAGFAWAMCVLGALEMGEGAPADLRYASTVVTAAPIGDRRVRPRATDPEQQAVERAVESERIASKHAQILDASYFAVLGVGLDASEHELRRAHARLRADFQPSSFSDDAAREHATLLAEIADVLDEALRVLTAPVRAQYASQLEQET